MSVFFSELARRDWYVVGCCIAFENRIHYLVNAFLIQGGNLGKATVTGQVLAAFPLSAAEQIRKSGKPFIVNIVNSNKISSVRAHDALPFEQQRCEI